MYDTFKKVTCHAEPTDIVCSSAPPFEGFTIPQVVHDFYKTVEEQQAARARPITGGFVFGGMFTSIQRGQRPKDYDIYIGAPRLIDALCRNRSEPVGSYKEMEERHERDFELLGYDFPLCLSGVNIDIQNDSLFGRHVMITSTFGRGNGGVMIDLKLGERDLTVEECARYMGAPITSVGATLGGTGAPFAYHKNYAAHAMENVLCHSAPSQTLLGMAIKKGWIVMTPEEWSSYSGSDATGIRLDMSGTVTTAVLANNFNG